jgi:hypothetical protein
MNNREYSTKRNPSGCIIAQCANSRNQERGGWMCGSSGRDFSQKLSEDLFSSAVSGLYGLKKNDQQIERDPCRAGAKSVSSALNVGG